MEFYAPHTQPILGPVVMLPQAGAVPDVTGRPPSSYALLRGGFSILFDAVYSWTLDGIRELARDGHPPRALVLSHRNTAGAGDAFEAIGAEFGIPVLLHPEDQDSDEARRAGVRFANPAGHVALDEAGLRIVHTPGHTPGSIMLYVEDEGGIFLTGDSALAPGPDQNPEPPRLERPKMPVTEELALCDLWRTIADRTPVAAILPLHGRPYLRRDLGDRVFDRAFHHIWLGAPMDPAG